MIGLHDIPIEVEVSRLQRETLAKVAAKMASQQLGEAWIGLDDRRHVTTLARGSDRREAA